MSETAHPARRSRWLQGCLLTLLLLGVVSVALFDRVVGSEAFRQRLLREIEARIPGTIAIEAIHSRLLSGLLEVEGIRFSTDRFECAARRIFLDLRLRDLLVERVRIEQLLVEGGGCAFERSPLRSSTPGTFRGTRFPFPIEVPFPLSIETFFLTDGSVRYHDPSGGIELRADRVHLFLTGELPSGRGRFLLLSPQVSITTPAFSDRSGRLRLDARVAKGVEGRLVWRGEGGSLRISASTEERLRPQAWRGASISGEIEPDLDLAHFANFLPSGVAPHGRLSGRLTLGGTLASPTARADLEVRDIRYRRLPVSRISLAATWGGRTLRIESLDLTNRGTLSLSGDLDFSPLLSGRGDHGRRWYERVPFVFDLSAARIDPARWIAALAQGGGRRGRPPLTGILEGRLHLEGSLQRLSGGGTMQFAGAPFGVPGRVGLQASLTHRPGETKFEKIAITAPGMKLSGEGSVAEGRFETAFRIDLLDLRRSGAFLGRDAFPEGSATLILSGHFPLDAPRRRHAFQLTLRSEDLRIPGRIELPSRLRLHATLTDGRVRLSGVRWAVGESHLSAQGTIDLLEEGRLRRNPPFSLTVESEHFDPADFGGGSFPLSGKFSARMTLGGELEAPRGRLRLAGRDLALRGTPLGEGTLAITLTNGRLGIEPCLLRGTRGRIAMTGEISLFSRGFRIAEDPRISLHLLGEDLDPKRLHPTLPLAGAFSLEAEVTGTLHDPRGTYRMTGKDVRFRDQELTPLHLAGRIERRTLYLDRLTTGTGEGKIEGRGEIAFDGRDLAFHLLAPRIPVAELTRFAAREIEASGLLSLELHATGSVTAPLVSGRLRIEGLELDEQTLGDSELDLETAGDEGGRATPITIAGHLFDRAISLSGKLDLAARRYRVTGRIERAPISPARMRIERFRGEMTIEGKLGDRGGRRIGVAFSELRLSANRFRIENRGAIRLDMRGEVLSVAACELAFAEGDRAAGALRVTGGIDLGGEIDLLLRGEIPVASLPLSSPDFRAGGGFIEVDALVAGERRRPHLAGSVRLRGVAFPIPGTRQRLHDLDGVIAFFSDRIEVGPLHGGVDDGRFSLEGRIPLADFRPVAADLALRAEKIPLEVPEALTLTLDSRLSLSGPWENLRLSGEIYLLSGRYTRRVRLSPIGFIVRKFAPPEPKRRVRFGTLPPVALDVAIARRGEVRVENNLAHLSLNPDLVLTGTMARPVLQGRASVLEGEIVFQRKHFRITRGVVDFVNPYRTEARIDIESVVEIHNVGACGEDDRCTITLRVKGTPEALEIGLSSDPPHEEGDIVSLLLFRKTTAQLFGREGEKTPEQILAALLGGVLGDQIRERTGLDYVEIAPGETPEAGTSLTVGKRFSRRLTLKYRLATGEEVTQEAIFEYRFLDAFLLSGFRSSDGRSGGDLRFRLEFR